MPDQNNPQDPKGNSGSFNLNPGETPATPQPEVKPSPLNTGNGQPSDEQSDLKLEPQPEPTEQSTPKIEVTPAATPAAAPATPQPTAAPTTPPASPQTQPTAAPTETPIKLDPTTPAAPAPETPATPMAPAASQSQSEANPSEETLKTENVEATQESEAQQEPTEDNKAFEIKPDVETNNPETTEETQKNESPQENNIKKILMKYVLPIVIIVALAGTGFIIYKKFINPTETENTATEEESPPSLEINIKEEENLDEIVEQLEDTYAPAEEVYEDAVIEEVDEPIRR